MDPTPFQRMFDDAKAVSGIQTLAVFAALCFTYGDEARREISYRLSLPTVEPIQPDGPLLGTAREAAATLGPSFTARKLYRITPSLPKGCAVRKGGRLYYHLPSLRKWAANPSGML